MWPHTKEPGRLSVEALSRRQLLRLCVGGGAVLLWPDVPGLAQVKARCERLLVRYKTGPDRIAHMLPPGLMPHESAEVQIEYLRVTAEAGSATALLASEYLVAAVRLAVEHEGQVGWFQPIRWTNNEWLRLWEREYLGLNTKRGEIDFKVEGAAITASLTRKGFRLNRVRTARTDHTAPGDETSQDRDTFVYKYAAKPDWREVPAQEPVGLWRIAASEPTADGLTRACDVESASIDWPHASALDPIAEFNALEILEVTYEERSGESLTTSDEQAPRFAAAIDATEFEPWGLVRYDRPVTAKRPWQSEGWPEHTTAFHLESDEIARYRARKEVRIDQFDMLDLRLMTTGEHKDDILPPPCRAGLRPVLRVLVLRIEESDLSPVPFSEAWLLMYCNTETERGWYALSHVCDEGGDVTFGREVLGYPSRTGKIDLNMSFREFGARCLRHGREFLGAQGDIQGVPTGTSLSQIPILGLRRIGSTGDDKERGELILQPWYFQGRYFKVDRTTVNVTLPEPEGESAVAFDPWHEFNPARVASVTVMMGGTMQRTPGQVVAAVPDFYRYYRERCDGVIPGVDNPNVQAKPTFGTTPNPVTRS